MCNKLKIGRGEILLKIVLLMALSGIYLFLAFSIENPIPRVTFIAVAIWLFIWGYKELKESADRKEEQMKLETEKMLNEIPHTQCVISDDYLTALLIDEDNEKVHLVSREKLSEDFKKETYHFNEILEAALIENDHIQSFITKGGKNQNSILNGEKKIKPNEDGVKKISVKFLVNNISKPEIEYVFFESDKSILKESEEYKEVIDICKDWFQKLSLIIKRSESIPVSHWE